MTKVTDNKMQKVIDSAVESKLQEMLDNGVPQSGSIVHEKIQEDVTVTAGSRVDNFISVLGNEISYGVSLNDSYNFILRIIPRTENNNILSAAGEKGVNSEIVEFNDSRGLISLKPYTGHVRLDCSNEDTTDLQINEGEIVHLV